MDRASQWARDGQFEDRDMTLARAYRPSVPRKDTAYELLNRQGRSTLPASTSAQYGSQPHQTNAEEQIGVSDQHLQPPSIEAVQNGSANSTGAKDPGQAPSRFNTLAAHRRRMATGLYEAPTEVRHTHDYLFRRPRPLLVEHKGHVLRVGEEETIDVKHPENSYHLEVKRPREHHTDSLRKQRERLDIFCDLIWVGIISNIAEHFHDELFGGDVGGAQAVGEFILLFMPAWRIWIIMQDWLNLFYTDDAFQRLFIAWILVLGIVWGNQAPYLLNSVDGGNNFTLITYIIAISSFGIMYAIYAYFLPLLRKSLLVSMIAMVPGMGLWIAATVVSDGDLKYGLLSGAFVLNMIEWFWNKTPQYDRIIGSSFRQVKDRETTIRRYENFYIVALGEGVFTLVRGSPLVSVNYPLNTYLARGINVLVLYYMLNWLYFHGDMSKRFVHGSYRNWLRNLLWSTIHIPLFAALVLLSSGTLFLVTFPTPYETGENASTGVYPGTGNATEGSMEGRSVKAITLLLRRAEEHESGASIEYDLRTLRLGTNTVCATLAITLACQLALGMLNKTLDKPGDLRVTNRYIRMVPRLLGIVGIPMLLLQPVPSPDLTLGVCLGIVVVIVLAERFMGAPRDAMIFEPKEESMSHSLTKDSSDSEGPN